VRPVSENEVAVSLAAAVAAYASDGTAAKLEAVGDGLDTVLYVAGSGCDGVFELAVSERTSTHTSFVGVVIWVTEQTYGPLEARFRHDNDTHRVTEFVVRAGDSRIARRDSAKFPASARALQRIIATRPTADEDWEYVVAHDLR
jgi:hypothetical protein